MKLICLLIAITCICFFSCKKDTVKDRNGESGNGFIYTDGDPAVVAGGIGWYFAISRVGSWKAFPLRESQLPADYKNITVADSIAVTISLEETKAPVGCDCPPGAFYYYDIISIKKR